MSVSLFTKICVRKTLNRLIIVCGMSEGVKCQMKKSDIIWSVFSKYCQILCAFKKIVALKKKFWFARARLSVFLFFRKMTFSSQLIKKNQKQHGVMMMMRMSSLFYFLLHVQPKAALSKFDIAGFCNRFFRNIRKIIDCNSLQTSFKVDLVKEVSLFHMEINLSFQFGGGS